MLGGLSAHGHWTMATLALLQQYSFTALGPMYISGLLQAHGHRCVLIVDALEHDLVGEVERLQPDIVGFQVFTGQQAWALDVSRRLKRRSDRPIFWGGNHATHNPEILGKYDCIDYICRGEGEHAVLELLDALESGADTSGIPNVGSRVDGELVMNGLRDLVDVDELPFPDRSLYYRYPIFRDNVVKRFITGRGCPYRCTFCHNHMDIDLYRGKGEWARKRRPQRVVEEILQVRRRYPLQVADFSPDDFFLSDRDWALDFLARYRREVDLPFVFNTRPETIDEEVGRALGAARCRAVSISIESADDHLRNRILRKGTRVEDMRRAVRVLKANGILVKTYNMIGLPGETIEQAIETLELNVELRPTWARCSLVSPYPDTVLWDIGVEMGLLSPMSADDFADTYTEETVFDLANKDAFVNLQRWFQVVVRFPALYPAVPTLIRMPRNRATDLMGKLTFGYYGSKLFGYSLGTKVRHGVEFLRSGQPI